MLIDLWLKAIDNYSISCTDHLGRLTRTNELKHFILNAKNLSTREIGRQTILFSDATTDAENSSHAFVVIFPLEAQLPKQVSAASSCVA